MQQLREELAGAVGDASDSALTRGPAGKWNSAQILEHLLLTYKNTNYGLGKCREKGEPLATSASLKHRLGKMLVVDLGYMPKGREAPQRAVPQGVPAAEVRIAIFAEIEKMESGFADCERLFGASTSLMDHPFIGPLTAGEWRKFHLVHGRHHAKQIRERLKE
ncbi:MAG TPA: DUF1569 domain-containing protein [Terriglobales bacterium]|nr:DUF1569 domain-containing protein [Terriglobales bacterium]